MGKDVFRIERPVTAVYAELNSHRFVSIPVGSTLTVTERFAIGFGLVKAEWDGHVVEVFLRDLQERAVRAQLDGTAQKATQRCLDCSGKTA